MSRTPCQALKPFLAAGVAVTVWTLSGCGGGGGDSGTTPPPPPPPVDAVTVQAPSTSVKIGETLTFTAIVTGSSTNKAVTWTVSGDGCSGAACGTISSSGLYTAPAIVPVAPTVTVKATAQADTTKSGSLSVTIGSDVAVSVWPQGARVTLSTSRQFLRMVTGSANEAVTWSISGMDCATSNCGSISSAGVYQAPPLMPPNARTVFVKATSVVDPGKSAETAVWLQEKNVNSLNGGYAFLYRGVWADSEGHLAGRFTADGNGGITGGVLDRTNAPVVGGQPAGNLTALAFSGGYTIEDDGRGLLSMGSVDFKTAVPASGERFFMQAFYDTSARGTALVMKQSGTVTTAAVFGNYVFQLTGSDVNRVRMANIGRFTADGAGNLSNGTIDTNDGLSGVIDSRSFTGTYSVGSNGRGTAQVTVPGVGSFNYALYVVSADTLIITSTDDLVAGKPMRIGFALRQSGGPLSAASLAGNYVFDMAGRNSASSAIATVGRLTSNGSGGITGIYDRNDNYTMTPATGQPVTATYTIDANGRGLLDATTMVRAVFYMVSPDKALIMEAPNARVQTGTMERQVTAPYSSANLLGRFASVSSPPALLTSLTVTGASTYSPNLAQSTLDIASPCALAPNSGATANLTVASNGRIDVRDASNVQHAAGYLVTPSRYVLVLQRPGGPPCDEVVHYYFAEQ